MDWWSNLSADQQLTIALAFLSAVLGGLISLSTTWFMARQNNKFLTKTKIQDRQENRALLAHKTFIKTLQYLNSVHSIKGAIEDQFDAAEESGHGHLLPVQKVQEIQLLETNFDPYNTEELVFLLHRENAELVGDLLVFEKRAMSAPQAVALYNEKRMELTKMLETGAVSTESDEDAIMSSELVGADAILADVRVSALQALLGEIMSRLEREEGDGMRFLSQFQDAAKSEFGDLYPNLKFEVQR